MQTETKRGILMGSVAMLFISAAHAQTQEPTPATGAANEEACVALSGRLAEDTTIDSEVRTGIEQIIAQGDAARCDVIVSTWENEGTFTQDALELVATDQISERVVVQQEVEVGAEVAVYQPPAEVSVDTGAPEVVWSMPRQSVQIEEQAPQITIRQGQPVVSVDMPQPIITVMMPEPEVIVTWPESTANLAAIEPTIEVRMPEPIISVNIPEPIVELALQGDIPESLVQLEDGRFAPQGSTAEELEPQISLQGQEPAIVAGQASQEPEILFNRAEPVVSVERVEPVVRVNVVGEPQIQIQQQGTGTNSNAPQAGTDGTGSGIVPPVQD